MSLQMEQAIPDGFVLEKTQNIMRGTYRGISLFVVPLEVERQYQIQLYTDMEKSRDKNGFMERLSAMPQEHAGIRHAGYNGSNMVSVLVESDGVQDKKNLTDVIHALVSQCEEFGVHNCCAHCKGDQEVHAAAVDHTPLLLCSGCLAQAAGRVNGGTFRKENLFLGFLGAVVGVLLGSVLWIVIGQIGFIAGIAGFAIVFCGMKGYEILGGRLTKKGIVLCVLLSFLAIFGAEIVSIGIVVYQEFGKEYGITMGDCFRVIPELLHEPEMIGGVAKDLMVGYALAIWASFANIKNAWRQVGEGPAQHTVVRF